MTHANTLFYGDNLTLLRDRAYFPDARTPVTTPCAII